MECYWHRCCGHWQIAGTLPQLLAMTSAGSQKGPHWVRTALYLLHASCYCDTAPTLGPLYVSFSLEWKHAATQKRLLMMTWAQNWSGREILQSCRATVFPHTHSHKGGQIKLCTLALSKIAMLANWKTVALGIVSLWFDEKNQQIED